MFRIVLLLLIQAAGVTDEETQFLPVHPGQNVTLPCYGAVNTTLLVVEWTRPDLVPPEYVFLYRDEQACPSFQHSSFRGRVELVDKHMVGGNVSLLLRNVSSGDDGVYECRVSNGTSKANLKTPPISVISVEVQDSETQFLPVHPGQNVTLPCYGAVNTTLLVVEWTRPDLVPPEYVFLYRDEQAYTSFQHSSFRGRVELVDKHMVGGNVSLLLRNVSSGDDGVYECRVSKGTSKANLKTPPISVISLEVQDSGSEEQKPRRRVFGLKASLVLLLVLTGLITVSWIRDKMRRQRQ